jgi:DNA topoisomerase-1
VQSFPFQHFALRSPPIKVGSKKTLKLVIVESPGKIKKISQYLGTDYQVVASFGHVRALADSGQDHTGVSLQNDPPTVECDYIFLEGASSRLRALKSLARQAQEVILATDPDREGEAIAWHLAQVLSLKKPMRAKFTEITQSAVTQAIQQSQPLDLQLVEAARTRDVLDKLVGYRLSPLLWKLNKGAKSAGRCQSAALHLLCQRDREIQGFVPKKYWRIEAHFQNFIATYENEAGQARIFDSADASQIAQAVEKSSPVVYQIQKTEQQKFPPPPLITSTLQQESGIHLGFSSQKTMKLAQQLYEAGVITYHRTDSVRLSPEFQGSVNSWLKCNHPKAERTELAQHSNRANSQAAHEAIRPLQVECRQISLNQDCQSLYDLIWNRAIASQCTEAIVEQMRVEMVAGNKRLVAQGQRLVKAGYTIFWNNLKADRLLPELGERQSLELQKVETLAEQTQPPSLFTEPSLVKRLETEGIGRPSTYATIIATLESRGYVKRESKKPIPTQLGQEVDNFLGRVVPKLIESSFTAQMENSLDQIAQGKVDWQNYLVQWYEADFFPALVKGQQLAETEFALPPDQETAYLCQFCAQPGLVKIFSNNPRLGIDHYLSSLFPYSGRMEQQEVWFDA